MDYTKLLKSDLVTMCQVYKNKIDYLNHLNAKDMFSFAKYLSKNYDYYDKTDNGDIYIHKSNKLKYTEKKIYISWLSYQTNDGSTNFG